MLAKLLKLTYRIMFISLLYVLILLVYTPFLVSWGVPKPRWFTFFYTFPIDALRANENHFLTSVLLNALAWGMITVSLWRLVKYLKVDRKSVV